MSVLNDSSIRRPRAPRLPPEDRRRRLLEAAIREFANQGYQQAGIGEICASAGVGRGTFYEYFPSKEELFRHLVNDHAGRLLGLMQPFHRQGLDGGTPAEILDRVTGRFRLIFRHFREERLVYRIFLTEAVTRNTDVSGLLREIQSQQVRLVEDELRDAMARGQIRQHPEPGRLAAFLLGGVMNVVYREIIDSEDEPDTDALAASVAAMSLAAVLPDANASRPDT